MGRDNVCAAFFSSKSINRRWSEARETDPMDL